MPVVAAPEVAVIVAVPFDLPARNLTITRPLGSVRASDGSMLPSDVVKVMSVPLCGGVPAASRTVRDEIRGPVDRQAPSSADVNVIVDPVGASSGTFSHATVTSAATPKGPPRGAESLIVSIMKSLNILIPMHLAGQERNRCHCRAVLGSPSGYAMVALLIALSVMSIMLAVAMPVWRQASQREKEAELVFRGKQYARAIELFQRKTPGALPPNVDLLVEQKYLRKKYKDPITGDDFLLVRQGEGTSGAQPGRSSGTDAGTRQRGHGPADSTAAAAGRGNVSRSLAESSGASWASRARAPHRRFSSTTAERRYNEWQFVYVAQTQTPGAGGAPGTGGAGQRRHGAAARPGGRAGRAGAPGRPAGRRSRRGSSAPEAARAASLCRQAGRRRRHRRSTPRRP